MPYFSPLSPIYLGIFLVNFSPNPAFNFLADYDCRTPDSVRRHIYLRICCVFDARVCVCVCAHFFLTPPAGNHCNSVCKPKSEFMTAACRFHFIFATRTFFPPHFISLMNFVCVAVVAYFIYNAFNLKLNYDL